MERIKQLLSCCVINLNPAVVKKSMENMAVETTPHQAINSASRVLNQNVSSHNGNREWEVGKHNNYDEIDDERGLKR